MLTPKKLLVRIQSRRAFTKRRVTIDGTKFVLWIQKTPKN